MIQATQSGDDGVGIVQFLATPTSALLTQHGDSWDVCRGIGGGREVWCP